MVFAIRSRKLAACEREVSLILIQAWAGKNSYRFGEPSATPHLKPAEMSAPGGSQQDAVWRLLELVVWNCLLDGYLSR
jgi:hypothetical protein